MAVLTTSRIAWAILSRRRDTISCYFVLGGRLGEALRALSAVIPFEEALQRASNFLNLVCFQDIINLDVIEP